MQKVLRGESLDSLNRETEQPDEVRQAYTSALEAAQVSQKPCPGLEGCTAEHHRRGTILVAASVRTAPSHSAMMVPAAASTGDLIIHPANGEEPIRIA